MRKAQGNEKVSYHMVAVQLLLLQIEEKCLELIFKID